MLTYIYNHKFFELREKFYHPRFPGKIGFCVYKNTSCFSKPRNKHTTISDNKRHTEHKNLIYFVIMAEAKTVLHMEKGKGGISSNFEKDVERLYAQYKNTDPKRAHLNFSLKIEGGILVRTQLKNSSLSLGQCIKERISQRDEPQKTLRRDAVTHVKFILSGSPERMQQMNQQEIEEWARKNFAFMAQRFGGAENIVEFAVHQDETTPHIHCVIVPLYKGKLSFKSMCNGQAALSQLQTDYANCMAEFGLERAEAGSKATHEELKDFYKRVHDAKKVDNTIQQVTADYNKGVDKQKENVRTFMTDYKFPRLEEMKKQVPTLKIPMPPIWGRKKWAKKQNENIEKYSDALKKTLDDLNTHINNTIIGVINRMMDDQQKMSKICFKKIANSAVLSLSNEKKLRERITVLQNENKRLTDEIKALKGETQEKQEKEEYVTKTRWHR